MTQVDELAKDTGRIRDRAESAGNCRLFKQGRHCSWIKWDDGSSVGWVVSRLSSHSILVSPRKRRRIERGKRGGWEKSILVRHKLQLVISINVWGSLVCCSSNARHSPSPASPAYGWSPTPAAAASGKKIAHEQHKYGCQGFLGGKNSNHSPSNSVPVCQKARIILCVNMELLMRQWNIHLSLFHSDTTWKYSMC